MLKTQERTDGFRKLIFVSDFVVNYNNTGSFD